jgi:hypothetical protein
MNDLIRQWFADNLDALRRESGHRLATAVEQAALHQVLAYWRKLGQTVAAHVTDTEVRLNLPGNRTPKDRLFNIEGVVDIVREGERTVMYDVKTHDAEHVRGNAESYQRQLNVYAHIWQSLQGQTLDETAIIGTALPKRIDAAMRAFAENPTPAHAAALDRALAGWNPIVPLPFNAAAVQAMMDDFAAVVDNIEDGNFEPPDVARLKDKVYPGAKWMFAVQVCTNCDARFSCDSYRQYARQSQQKGAAMSYFREYFDDYGPDDEREAWTLAALSALPSTFDDE